MTPGISCNTSQVEDQKYREIPEVDTDFIIVGRALYQSNDIVKTVENYVTLTNLD